MTQQNNGGPAFPTPSGWNQNGSWLAGQSEFEGMTLRDYFAAKAMQAMLSSPNCPVQVEETELASQAYMAADAMLKARAQ